MVFNDKEMNEKVMIRNTGYIRLYDATIVPLFLLSPLLALPYILWGIYRQKRSAYFFFSLFLGFLAWLQIPFADLFRHTMNAYNYFGKPMSYVFQNNLSSDFFIPLVSWILVNKDIPYQFLRLFAITESSFLMTIIFNYMIEKSNREYTNGEVFIRFCIMYFFFEFIRTTSGVRYGFALYQYIFAMHLAINKRSYLSALFFAILAIEIHFSFMFFIPISIILYYLCNSIKKAIVIFLFLSSVMLALISNFSFMLGRRADWYFGGGNSISDNTINTITIYGFILFVAVRLFLLPYAFLAIKNFDVFLKWSRMTIVWAGMAIVFITNLTLMVRVTFILSAIGIFLLLEVESYRSIQKRFITLILWCGILTTLFNVVNYRTYILNSRFHYITLPVPIILQNQYDKQWILEHINENKIIKNTYE